MIALLALLTFAVPVCHAINADRITGRDLAAAEPTFKALPPELPVGLAPFPGLQRRFLPGELLRLAEAHHVAMNAIAPLCFEWTMKPLDGNLIRAAMEKTLADRHPQIEIVEQSNVLVPPGEMTFPIEGLSGVSTGPVLWRGYVTFAEKRTYTIWARVRVTVHEQHVVADQALKPGDEIRAEQIQLSSYEGPLTREPYLTATPQALGATPRNPIAAGQALTSLTVRRRLDVERGDLVQVRVELRGTHLEAQGVAEEGGQDGAVITVRNDRSGRKFRARVESKGKVLVLPEGPTGLVVEGARHDAGN